LTAESQTSTANTHHWSGHTTEKVSWEVFRGDSFQVLSEINPNTYNCAITSPPYYWQRDYKIEGQIGLEKTIQEYVEKIVNVMDAVQRVLTKNGLLFLNLGDTYYSAKGQPKGDDKKNGARRLGLRAVDTSGLGVPRKTIIGIPWRIALSMIDRGWILRSPIIWHREASLPEPSARDRPWRTHEMVFMFSKTPKYYFNREGLGEDEDIWTISDRPKNAKGIHSAAFPEQLVQRCLDIGCPAHGKVLDPFAGSGTVLRVALQSGRPATGIDLSEDYCQHMVKDLQSMSHQEH
jgi:DNA modification methylase